MRENATLHFDLSHLAPDQTFTLHAGRERHTLAPHTPQTLSRARRENDALRLIPDHRVTHYAQPSRLPSDAPMLLRVTAPRHDPDDLLDRLALVSIYLPRRHRAAALARGRRRRGHPCGDDRVPHPKLTALGAPGAGPGGLPSDKALIDLGDMNTAQDAAAALVFHHGELMTLNGAPAADIINNIIFYSAGIDVLATSIYDQAVANEKDKNVPSWANSGPGTDWTTGAPDPEHPQYSWSPETLAKVAQPVRSSLKVAKDTVDLKGQCWAVLPGITQVPLPIAPGPLAGAAAAEATYTVTDVTPQCGVSHTFAFDPSSGKATMTLGNTFLRWLQVSVDQFAPGGGKVGTTQDLGMLSPPDTIMSVPLPTAPSDFTFTFEEGASSARLTLGGLGQAPYDWDYDRFGIGCTMVFNYAVPTIFIALGVAVDVGGGAWTEAQKDAVPKILALLEAATGGPLATATSGSDVTFAGVMLAVGNLAGALLVSALTSADKLAAYITTLAGQGAAEAAEPFLGWASLAIGATADAAGMIETTVAVAGSRALMELGVARVVDIAVTVDGDHDHQGQWPATATSYVVTVTYTDGPSYTYSSPFDPDKQKTDPIVHTFTGLPAGGTFTVLLTLYSDSGWVPGVGLSAAQTIPQDVSTVEVPAFTIKENLVPLSTATTYGFDEKLTYGASGRVFTEAADTTAPTATVSSLDDGGVGSVIGVLGQITLNESLSTLGYSWQAAGQGVPLVDTGNEPYSGQENTFQIISDVDPEAGLAFCQYAYSEHTCIAFPPPTMPEPPATGFLLEPQTSATAMHLRELPLAAHRPLVPTAGMSFGRFEGAQDDLDIHPKGYAVALSRATSKLQVVKLGPAVPDADAPQAAILAGQGTREGLLYSPVALSCSLDRIIVLQTTPDAPQGALSAFDTEGNPVPRFAGGASTVALRTEGSAVVRVVDVSVESRNYVFVLKYLAPRSGAVPASAYRLDIHNPDGSFLTQVAGLAAAALHVDLWRNVFTLNYEIVVGSGRTEPSVSKWIPSTPPGLTGPPRRDRSSGPRDDRRGGRR